VTGPAEPGQVEPQHPDPRRFRHVLGQFATGVTVVTSMDGDEPVGFACQAFAALSLEPPLVLFCPGKSSGSWAAIERAGTFCVNVLGEGQRDVSRVFGTRGADKFGSVEWCRSQQGMPVLEGVLSWIDCAIEAVHTAGDHYVVIGRVLDLGTAGDDRPLLFYRGDYTAAEVPSELLPSGGPADPELASALLETMMSWPRQQDWI
jgi:3-hydroxy-9,10-secoandrosta-1,3,5(10)-triene-9,17-dione monooxygenase reductase component